MKKASDPLERGTGLRGGQQPKRGGNPCGARTRPSPRIALLPPLFKAPRLKRGDVLVWVNPYQRFRFGRTEFVCGHYRSR
ncbi:MAG: hypothetical protein E5V67_05860 [Mesorhizobium sp.]|nr:hypothetical protein EN860_012385 [Mesorhizobium sp. M00.F.Ca.ET.217.01.1.1]TGV94903.1 hypothetical protein EN801_004645 [Mesorhizobium sp. M00.F.Ca.ET.158.01.1.1]TIU87808.1 MAG: hypothetical protein E5W06_04510 [Mesorhizobium sp.]TKB42740.1 MAG: hypothetical protein E5V67_05860 [Mesorhizobium sp.]